MIITTEDIIYINVGCMREFASDMPAQASNHIANLAGGPSQPITQDHLSKAVEDFTVTFQVAQMLGDPTTASLADECVCGITKASINPDIYRNSHKGEVLDLEALS